MRASHLSHLIETQFLPLCSRPSGQTKKITLRENRDPEIISLLFASVDLCTHSSNKEWHSLPEWGNPNDAAKICCIEGSPMAWPKLSRTTIEAYKVAFASSAIQYDTSERANTLLPNPAATMKTPAVLSGGLVRRFRHV